MAQKMPSSDENERTFAEIVQACSYHSMIHNINPDTIEDDDDSYDGSEEEWDGDDDEDSGDEDNGNEGSEGAHSKLQVPTFALTRVRCQDELTLPEFRPYALYSGGHGCSNTPLRDDLWLRDPELKLMGSNMSFLSQLAQLCIQAKIRDCTNPKCLEKKEAMDLTAPKCDWSKFRDWALVSMSCQAAMSREQKLTQAHTHLAKAASGCSIILKECVNAKVRRARFLPFLDGNTSRQVDLAGVSNVIYWMAKIQADIGIGPKRFGKWSHRFLPARVTLPAIEKASMKAEKFHLCKNRLWNLVTVSDRKQCDLPDIIEAIEPHEAFLAHKDHEHCTPSKCQWAHMNSETVVQLHKCCADQEKVEDCEQKIFPVDLLETALELGSSTAWLCDTVHLSKPSDPYMAISHVWSDGTGVGAKNPGSVNKCLFEFFAGIATRLDCKAVWWDALSIPQEASARSKALNKMHWNYANAKVTLVHDKYLLDFEWRDDGSPCLALVLSTWFTRGWTALELIMSKTNKVKVLFKDPKGGGPLIKDLDEHILAPGPGAVSRAHWLATSLIQRLRRPIDNVGDLLVILTPRSTSWVRDRTVIAGLLAGVPNCDFRKSESIIARKILTYLGKIPYTCLFHGKPTMSDSGGFSWCPAVIDDMPVDLSMDMKGGAGAKKEALLEIDETGAVEGYWWCRRLERLEIDNKKIKPFGDNISATVKINNALRHWKHCLLLRNSLNQNDLALLVVPYGVKRADPLLKCRYVGAVVEDCEESTLNNDPNSDPYTFAWDEFWVQIGGTDNGTLGSGMRGTKALETMYHLCDASDQAGSGESQNSNIPELADYVQSSDEEVANPTPTSDDNAWYKSRTALDYHRLDVMNHAESASNFGGPDPQHLFIAVKRGKKKAMQYLVKQKIELTVAQKKYLFEDLGTDKEARFYNLKMLGDVYVENDMLEEAIETYRIAVDGYESLDSLEDPQDLLKAKYALSSVYVKVGKHKRDENDSREVKDLYKEAEKLLKAILAKCKEKAIRRQMKKMNKSAQSKNAGNAGPATTGSTAKQPDRRSNSGKDNKTFSATNKKSDMKGNQAKSNAQGSADLVDDWYRIELNTIGDLTLLYADDRDFYQASKTFCEALTRFGTAPEEIEIFTEEWKSRPNQPYDEKKKRDEEAGDVYERALRRFDSIFRTTHVLNMITAANLGINYALRNMLQEAEEMLRRAQKGFEELISSAGKKLTEAEDIMTLLTIRHLGVLLTGQHKFDEAQKLLERARSGFSSKLDPKDSLTLAVSCDLAQNYLSRKPPQYSEAEMLFQVARIGSDRRLTFRAALGLSKVHTRKGVENAIAIFKNVLWRLQHQTKTPDLDVCDGLLYLGRIYEEQKNLEDAETTFQECLAGFKQLDGPLGIKYLQAVKRLGYLCDKLQKPDEAEQLLSEALNGFEKVLGGFHSRTLTIARDLGSLYLRHKKPKYAEALCDRAYKGFEKVKLADQDNQSIAEAAHALGTAYLEQGKFSQAQAMYARAFRAFQSVMRENNDPLVLRAAMDLGQVCMVIGGGENNKTAEMMYKHAISGFTKAKGPYDALTLDAQLKLGEVYRQQGKHKLAELKIQGALNGFKLNLPQDRAKMFEAMLRLGHLKFDQKNTDEGHDQDQDVDTDEAASLIREARDGLVRSLGPDDLLSLDASALLGEVCLSNDDDMDEGVELLKIVLDDYCEKLIVGHPKTIRIMNCLIHQYKESGRPREAEEMRRRKREALEKGHGADYAVMIMEMTDWKRTKRSRWSMWDDDSDWDVDGEDRSELNTSGDGSEEEDANKDEGGKYSDETFFYSYGSLV